jgi:hypothetical protein
MNPGLAVVLCNQKQEGRSLHVFTHDLKMVTTSFDIYDEMRKPRVLSTLLSVHAFNAALFIIAYSIAGPYSHAQ